MIDLFSLTVIRSSGRHLLIALSASLAGCANMTSIHHEFSSAKPKIIAVDMKQRIVIVQPIVTKDGKVVTAEGRPLMYTCTEPSPDAISSWGASLKGGLKAGSTTIQDLAATLNDTASYVGQRTETVQLLRDGMFRSCEAYINNMMQPGEFVVAQKHYQNIMLGLVAMEQLRGVLQPASANTSSLSARPVATSNPSDPTGDPSAAPGAPTTKKPDASATDQHSKTLSRARDKLASAASDSTQTSTTPIHSSPADVAAVTSAIVQIVNHIIIDDLYIDSCDPDAEPDDTPQSSVDWEKKCSDLLSSLLLRISDIHPPNERADAPPSTDGQASSKTTTAARKP